MRYLRSLSFIQGTAVNLLRTSIMFLMLYLIYTRAITVGQFFSLFIYSFFIFGPLQELGNIINIYRETEASLNVYEEHPADAEGAEARRTRCRSTICGRWPSSDVTFQHQSASSPAVSDISFGVERGETIAFVGPSGAGKTTLVKLLVGLYQPAVGPDSLQRHRRRRDRSRRAARADRLRDAGHAALLRHDSREPAVREPDATDAECLDVLRKAACDSLLARADRRASTRSSAKAASRCPAARSSGCRSRARCCAGRICWSSTRRPRRSTR